MNVDDDLIMDVPDWNTHTDSFFSWLQEKQNLEVVGRGLSLVGCPIGNYFSQYYPDAISVCVSEDRISFDLDGGEAIFDLPPVFKTLCSAITEYAMNQWFVTGNDLITASEVLAMLEIVQKEIDDV